HMNIWYSSSHSPSLPCRLSFPLVHLPGMFHVEQRRMSEGGNLARAAEWSRHQDWHPSERGSWRLAGSNGALEVRVQAHAPPGLSDWSTRHRSRAVSRRAVCGSTPVPACRGREGTAGARSRVPGLWMERQGVVQKK